MANEKISQMPPASTPLTGTELLPLVQSGINVSVGFSTVIPITVAAGITKHGAAAGGTEVHLRSAAVTSGTSGLVYIASGVATGTGASGATGMESGESEADTGGIFIGTSTPTVAGTSGDLILYTGDGTGSGNASGSITITTGGATVDASGAITISTGLSGGADSGEVAIYSGSTANGFNSGTAFLSSGDILTGSGNSGLAGVCSGLTDSGNSGLAQFYSGDTASGNSGEVELASGNAAAGNSGRIVLFTGDAAGSGKQVGSVVLKVGTASGGAATGNYIITALKTSDPSTTDAIFAANSFIQTSGANARQSSSAASPGTSLSTGSAADVTTLTLAAGKWAIFGSVYFTGAGATTVTRVAGSLSTTLNTIGTAPGSFGNAYLAGATITTIGQDIAITGMAVTDLSGSATYHLVAQATFATSTLTAYGLIFAIPIT